MTDFAVGDEVVLTFGRSWQGTDGDRAVVTRVGRKWAYVKDGWKEHVFDKVTGVGKSDNYGTSCRAYRPAEYEAKRARAAIVDRLQQIIRKHGEYGWQKHLTDEQIGQLTGWLEGGQR